MHAWHASSQHLSGLPLRMTGMHRMPSDHPCLYILSLTTWSRTFWPSITWNLCKAPVLERKHFCLRSESWNLSAVPNLWILLVVLFFVLCKKSLLCCSCLNFREDFVGLEIESTSHHYFKFLIILMTLEYPFPCRKCFIKYAHPMARFYELWFFTKMDYKLWLNILSKLYVLCC